MTDKFKPLLAATVEPHLLDKLDYPLYVSPKLDGIRVVVKDGIVLTRSLKPLPNLHVQRTLGHDIFNGMDGEIMVGDPCGATVFRETTSAVMNMDGKPDFVFYVFDWHGVEGGFGDRYSALVSFLSSRVTSIPYIRHVEHGVMQNPKQVMDYEDGMVKLGYEGIMLRSTNGRYKYGRSTMNEQILLKLKRFQQSEAFIVGFQERMHNANEAKVNALGHKERSTHKANLVGRGDLGALWAVIPKLDVILDRNFLQSVVDQLPLIAESQAALKKFNETNGKCVLFTVGSGFDDEERQKFWDNKDQLLFSLLTFKHMEYGGFDAPRFPVYKGLRDVRDI